MYVFVGYVLQSLFLLGSGIHWFIGDRMTAIYLLIFAVLLDRPYTQSSKRSSS